jgi:hypothetical protein
MARLDLESIIHLAGSYNFCGRRILERAYNVSVPYVPRLKCRQRDARVY